MDIIEGLINYALGHDIDACELMDIFVDLNAKPPLSLVTKACEELIQEGCSPEEIEDLLKTTSLTYYEYPENAVNFLDGYNDYMHFYWRGKLGTYEVRCVYYDKVTRVLTVEGENNKIITTISDVDAPPKIFESIYLTDRYMLEHFEEYITEEEYKNGEH